VAIAAGLMVGAGLRHRTGPYTGPLTNAMLSVDLNGGNINSDPCTQEVGTEWRYLPITLE